MSGSTSGVGHLGANAEHLSAEVMAGAQRRLLAKALAEFSHERLIAPEVMGQCYGGERFSLRAPHLGPGDETDGENFSLTRYEFSACRLALEHWVVDPESIVVVREGREVAPDVQRFVVEFAEVLQIPEHLLSIYLEEIAATLASSAWKAARAQPSVEELLSASHQQVEAAMTEGHPAFVANNGRIGFGLDDHAAYAPETGATTKLLWLAVRRTQSHLSLAEGLDAETHWERELGPVVRARFAAVLRERGDDPDEFHLMPVHPWQWANKIAVTFAPDVARGDLVLLGEGEDDLQPQQSIRTFFPVSSPERSFVKTALAVQNMGFLRGLSPAYMVPTPAINDWFAALVAGDRTLQECGMVVLREHAAIGWTGDVHHRIASPHPKAAAYRKMLAALWRESPVPHLAEGERLVTMAALLHRDAAGHSYVSALVRASGVAPREWVDAWLRVYLRPYVHLLLAHDTVLMPHGENVILALRDHLPVRAFAKDIGEEVAVLSRERELPEELSRIRADVPVDEHSLSIHTDIFDGVLRHVAGILHVDGVLDEKEFWGAVRDCIEQHRDDHPELADAHALHDLLRPRFKHSCLNRLQLRNTLAMVDLADQSQSLIHAGTLANPATPGERRPGVPGARRNRGQASIESGLG